ncbi:MAG: hypothetical protein GVY36_06675 [Verrucomicrobia bacterium]|jgi:hypothetical protein|nr:hypothetical protein [Verrucomicrobiota bacterium]
MESQDKKTEKPLSFEELADQKPDPPKKPEANKSTADSQSAKKPQAPVKPPIAPKKPTPKPITAADSEPTHSTESAGAGGEKPPESAKAAQKKPSITPSTPKKTVEESRAAKQKVDPSISVDDDAPQVSGVAIAIDAIAAAAAIAFTILIMQEVLPFLK